MDGAVDPTTGARCFLEWPPLHTITVQIFLHEVAHDYQETLHMVRMENGSGQKATSLVIPAHGGCLVFPP
jgi:hypothetical protein